jgi:hypothetical protein
MYGDWAIERFRVKHLFHFVQALGDKADTKLTPLLCQRIVRSATVKRDQNSIWCFLL